MDNDRKLRTHAKNRLKIAYELEKMSRYEDPYQYFKKIPSNVLGMLHFAAWYLEGKEE